MNLYTITIELLALINSLLSKWGIANEHTNLISIITVLSVLIAIFYIIKHVLTSVFSKLFLNLVERYQLRLLTHAIENKLPNYLAILLPYLFFQDLIPLSLETYPIIQKVLVILLYIYFVFLCIILFMAVITSGAQVLKERPAFRTKPLESYLQVVRMIAFFIGAVIIFSKLTGKSPTTFFAAMGAASAILLLMFKDTIMGFVASIQVTTNDMVRLGDRITMQKYGADGEVIEINLTTVKVQNFDKTITTIPTYALISDSFQNWRGMENLGGRRIKRAIYIKQSSIRYIHPNEFDRFRLIPGIAHYIDQQLLKEKIDPNTLANNNSPLIAGKRLTNAGLFRMYIEWFLDQYPKINSHTLIMVRQLPLTPDGLPIEILCFTNTDKWLQHEHVVADIFDQLLAAVPFFDLLLFENASSSDVVHVVLNKSEK